jgi:hypothetical protein
MVVVHIGSKLLMFIDAVGYSTDWVGGGIIICELLMFLDAVCYGQE